MKEIRLGKSGLSAKVDDEDFAFINSFWWKADFSSHLAYARTQVHKSKKWIKMHRLIMLACKGEIIDHIDGDGLNNCRSNLRFVSHSQNVKNAGKYKKGGSKYKGVYIQKRTGRFMASIQCDKKRFFVGLFNSEIEAARARDIKAKELHGEFARLNGVTHG